MDLAQKVFFIRIDPNPTEPEFFEVGTMSEKSPKLTQNKGKL